MNDCEILIKCNYRLHPRADTNALFTFLINSSPLTRYHSLICPSLSDNLSQILTEQSIRFAVDVLRGFDDNCYRIGFNSLGALASVNHLHMHLMHIETDLFIENVVRMHARTSYAEHPMHVQYYIKTIMDAGDNCLTGRATVRPSRVVNACLTAHVSISIYRS